MDRRAHPSCQTFRRAAFFALCGVLLPCGVQAQAASPPPAPTPVWQPELDALRLREARRMLMPAAESEKGGPPRDALAESGRRLAAKYPAAAPVQKAAGDAAALLDQPEEAMERWLRAEALDPRDAATEDSLGEAFLRVGQAGQAYRRFARAVESQPGTASYHYKLANVLYLFRRELAGPAGLPDEQAVLRAALDHFRQASELAPDDLRLAQGYAETFYIFARPDWQQALAAWQRVLALSGGQTDLANGHLARISLHLEQPAEARRYLDQIRNPGFEAMKLKFRAQAALLEARPADPPPAGPAGDR